MHPLVKGWKVVTEVDGDWCVSPGVAWCAAGFKIRLLASAFIGDEAIIGDRASIGARAIIGDRARIGDWAIIGDWASISDEAIIGVSARIGDEAIIGARASIGDWASIGDQASIGGRASIGGWARIGARASIGAGASVGDWARIGDEASIGARARFVNDLGSYEGYRKVICELEGVAHIGAGCRWFTLPEAIAHWKKNPERKITLAAMEVAKAIAKAEGLKLK